MSLRVDCWRELDCQLEHHIATNRLPGVACTVIDQGERVYERALGWQDVDQHRPMALDTICRIESMTKVVTCTAAMLLCEEQRLDLNAPVARYVPAFGDSKVSEVDELGHERLAVPNRPMLIRDLLCHTAGLSYGSSSDPVDERYRAMFRDLDLPGTVDSESVVSLQMFASRLAEIPLAYHPGSGWRYSMATDLLGHVVERVSDLSLTDFMDERLFGPLGMDDTGFRVCDHQLERFGPLYRADGDGGWRTVDRPDESKWRRSPLHFVEAGGGLVSTVSDFARFLAMLLASGESKTKGLLQPESVAWMVENHVPANVLPIQMGSSRVLAGCCFGAGFSVLLDAGQSLLSGSPGVCSWAGAASTGYWFDPHDDLAVVQMAQVVPNEMAYLDLMAPVQAAINQCSH